MRRISLLILCIASLTCRSFRSAGENGTAKDSTDFYNMSLEQLMNVEVSIASRASQTPRESPGIVTVITREEILHSGASDLMELLSRVPGFDFGVDVQGVVGVSVRGNWAHEGKVLMMIDGFVMNEDLYSTLQFGSHYPVDQIRRVEIIRGPGSSMYGGNAEYAVINIITINNEELQGVSAGVTYGQMSRIFSERSGSLSVGQKFGQAQLNVSTIFSQGNRSQRLYHDNMGGSYDMSEASGIETHQYRADFRFKGLTVSGMYDQYLLQQQDNYDAVLTRPYPVSFNNCFGSISYNWKPLHNLSVTPTFRYAFQSPWKCAGSPSSEELSPFDISVNNASYSVAANYDLTGNIHLLAGGEYSSQNATDHLDTEYFSNGSKNFYLANSALYLQGLYKSRIANFILGARYNQNNQYAPSFVPRAGITRTFNTWHFKILYSWAFRAPSIENIDVGVNIKPEKTSVIEFETGCKITRNSYLTLNVFDILTRGAIVFYYDVANEDAYRNLGIEGTRGIEAEYKLKFPSGYLNAVYSYYKPTGKELTGIYDANTRPELHYGFPAHKAGLYSNIRLFGALYINPAVTWQSERVEAYYDNNGDSKERMYPSCYYVDIFFSIEHLFLKSGILSVGCKNLFDQEVDYIQPYNSNHAALPGASRILRVKWTMDIPFTH